MRFRLLSVATVSLLAFAEPATAQGYGFAAPGGGPAVDCQGNLNSLMSQRDAAGKALQEANKKKADVKVACGLLRNYVGVESKMLKFLRANKAACGVPDNFLQQLAQSHAHSSQMSTKVCQVAANGGGGAAAPRTPSAGLSEALGVNTGGGNAADEKPSAVFDTLHGNVLSR